MSVLLCLILKGTLKRKKVKMASQSRPTLCVPMACSPPGSSVHGILQASILGWVAVYFIQGIFPTQGSNLGLLQVQADSLPCEPPGEVTVIRRAEDWKKQQLINLRGRQSQKEQWTQISDTSWEKWPSFQSVVLWDGIEIWETPLNLSYH